MTKPEPSLGGALRYRLLEDQLRCIGDFHIDGPHFNYALYDPAAGDWLYSLYAWVSTHGSGTVMRVGKSEGPLRIRLAGYKRSLERAMSPRLGPNEFCLGDTQPWEVVGWRQHVGGSAPGLIFARPVKPERPRETHRQALVRVERTLIAAYDPPLCGVSPSGRRAKQGWEAVHGPVRGVSARTLVPG